MAWQDLMEPSEVAHLDVTRRSGCVCQARRGRGQQGSQGSMTVLQVLLRSLTTSCKLSCACKKQPGIQWGFSRTCLQGSVSCHAGGC